MPLKPRPAELSTRQDRLALYEHAVQSVGEFCRGDGTSLASF
jgi:hypothetical protein